MADKKRSSRIFIFCVLAGIGLYLAGHATADEREAKLEQLRGRIGKLQRDLNETVGRRDAARDQLHAEEQRINTLTRSLKETDTRLVEQTRVLGELRRREQRSRAVLRDHLRALEAQIRAAYTVGTQPHLKVVLNQENPATAARVLTYYRYFNEARVARINETHSALAHLTELENAIAEQTRELNRLRATQEQEHRALQDSRKRRTEMVAALNKQVTSQTQEISRLRADEERLATLLRELKTIVPDANTPFPGPNERFATLKGRLPLPIVGRVTAHYGEPKGVGALTWRGLFLSGKEGQSVRAISRGRVVFADWLRGFGLLLILDHGDGYMTLYGHNETLNYRAGEWVEAGQSIATVGNTGDAPGTGVYFEIRHNGIPHDPLQWCANGQKATARRRR